MQDNELTINLHPEWGTGPWSTEPDLITWNDSQSGFPCIMRRNDLGGWCGYWWFGFDCAHYTDFLPAIPSIAQITGGTYKDAVYVKKQVDSLARQLAPPLLLSSPAAS
jgi:hypothetical protein